MPKIRRTDKRDSKIAEIRAFETGEPDAWREQGRCWGKTTNPATDYWFPDSEEPERIRKTKTNIAKGICYSCPVKEECLRYAIEEPETYGIWAGKTPKERAQIRLQWEEEGLL